MAALYEYTDAASGSGSFFSDVAGEALGKHKLVYLAADSLWYLADADDANKNPVLGLTLESIAANVRGRILVTGYVANPVWAWVVGGDAGVIYASATPGELTQTPPVGFIKMVAVAKTSTSILFNAGLSGGNTLSYDPVHTASYIIWVDGATYYAKNGITGEITNNADFSILINACISNIPYATGGSIYIKNGTYVVNSEINVQGHLLICGDGPESTIIKAGNAYAGKLMNWQSTVNHYFFMLRDLELHGNSTANGFYADNASGGTTTDIHIDHVFVVYTATYGIKLTGGSGWGGKIDKCLFEFNLGCGLHVESGSQIVVTNSFFAYNKGAYAVEFDYSWVIFTQNYVYQNDKTGLLLSGGTKYGAIISNNEFIINGNLAVGYGVYLDSGYQNCVITNNYFDGVSKTKWNIYVTSNNNIISNNQFKGSTTAEIQDTGTGNKISNNIGYTTESSGTATLLNGQTTIAVAHGCSYTPSLGHISIVWGENPSNVIGDWWIDTITATHFTLNGVDPGASNLDFGWSVRRI